MEYLSYLARWERYVAGSMLCIGFILIFLAGSTGDIPGRVDLDQSDWQVQLMGFIGTILVIPALVWTTYVPKRRHRVASGIDYTKVDFANR